MNKAIGIDLGTTNSCVGVMINLKPEIITNDVGDRITPSYVSFSDEEILIGLPAKDKIVKNFKNTIFDAKRLIGRKFDDPNIQNDIKLWPFKVVEGNNNKIEIVVNYLGEEKRYKPEQISALILTKMKEIAESKLNEPVKDAVITVPAYFNNEQRQATMDAGKIAGLNVLRIINEPTAAAIAYGFNNKIKDKNVLVFDLGGGTFDVSVLNINEGIFEVKSTSGDTHLGGEDFDYELVKYCIKEFYKSTKIEIKDTDKKALRKLKNECEKAKIILSSSHQVNIEIDSLINGEDFEIKLSRTRLENILENIFEKCIDPIKQALEDSKLSKEDIDEVILVGGSSRIPKIQQIVSKFFNEKKLNLTSNLDEAIAYGATIQASILSNQSPEETQDLLLLDITPLSLGIETHGGIMENLINRNTKTPCKGKKNFTTCKDNQNSVRIKIYEGERKLTLDNKLLDQFVLNEIEAGPKYSQKIEVTFDINSNSILTVSALNIKTNKQNRVSIENKSNLTEEEIEVLIEEAEEMKQQDILNKRKIMEKNKIEDLIYECDDLLLLDNIDLELKNSLKEHIEICNDLCLNILNNELEFIADEIFNLEALINQIKKPNINNRQSRNEQSTNDYSNFNFDFDGVN